MRGQAAGIVRLTSLMNVTSFCRMTTSVCDREAVFPLVRIFQFFSDFFQMKRQRKFDKRMDFLVKSVTKVEEKVRII